MTPTTRRRWKARTRFTAGACAAMLAATPVAQAAQQCFHQAGTYGALTVTTSGPGCGTTLSFGGITGVWMGDTNATENCTFNLSPAVNGSTIQITLTAHSCNPGTYCEEARFSLNGVHYAVQTADLVTPFGGGTPVMINGSGDIIEAPGGTSAGSGVVTFHSAPSSVSSVDINHVVTLGSPNGTIYQVCADDAGGGPPPPPPPTLPVPTISQWGLVVLAGLLGVFGVWRRRRA